MNLHVASTYDRAFCICLLLLCVADPISASDELTGAWAFSLPDGNPAWLKVRQDGQNVQADLLWSVGSAKPVRQAKIENGMLSFERNVSWKPFGENTVKKVVAPFVGSVAAGKLVLQTKQNTLSGDESAETELLTLVGTKIPPAPAKPDLSKVKFGKAIPLFNGKDLTGWKLSRKNKTNGWRVENGLLVNETPKQDFGAYGDYGNLVTEQQFYDFELTIDYNVPKKGNSGIYLRGMYEAQVVDRDSRMQGIQGPGAIFGRIKPTKNAGNAGGKWNRYVLTLVDRHITVQLNGETVVDNQLLEGCTGGGIQSNDALPGPIFLQGDHTAVSYRNIVLRPVEHHASKR